MLDSIHLISLKLLKMSFLAGITQYFVIFTQRCNGRLSFPENLSTTKGIKNVFYALTSAGPRWWC